MRVVWEPTARAQASVTCGLPQFSLHRLPQVDPFIDQVEREEEQLGELNTDSRAGIHTLGRGSWLLTTEEVALVSS